MWFGTTVAVFAARYVKNVGLYPVVQLGQSLIHVDLDGELVLDHLQANVVADWAQNV